MRIVFVLPNPTLNGGMRVVAVYARRLQDRGHRVTIAFHARSPQGLRKRIRALRHKWSGAQKRARAFFDGLGVPQIRVRAERERLEDVIPDADAVVATWWRTAEEVAALSPAKGAKTYFLQHYEIHPGLPIDRVKATWSLPLHKIVVHRWLADVARDEYGDTDVSVVPNSVDTNLFDSPPRGKQPRPTVGTMYSAATFKRCDVAIGAVEIARRTRPDLRFLAFGAIPPAPELPLPPGTEYAQSPPQTQIRDTYAQCDAWLFASECEGFGLPVLEAMACRTPVIGTPTGIANDVLTEGKGILVPLNDPEAMARAILRIADMPDAEWRAMSEAAHAEASQYTWDHATTLFEQALQTAIDRRTGAPTA